MRRQLVQPGKSVFRAHQWVVSVSKVSSEYGRGWDADCMTGPPTVYPKYGDVRGAWAPLRSRGTHEFAELLFLEPVYPTSLLVYETFNPGAIVSVKAQLFGKPEGWVSLWEEKLEARPSPSPESRILKIRLSLPDSCAQKEDERRAMRVNVIRLELDCTQSQSWAEIDAVQLRGSLCFQWEPSTHHLFPQSFKSMVKEMLLINRKLNAFSQDILHEIFNIAASGWALTTADQMGSGEGLRYWPCGKHCGEVYLCKGSACGCQGGPVLGGVGMYAQESNKCSSAVHAGVISAKEGGFFRLVEIAGQLSYEQGREAYGITPLDFGPSCGSFVICKLERPLACGLSSFEFVPGVFICRGKISGCTGGVVYGTDTYSPRSNVCSAALHAGVIGLEGGSFSVAKHPNYKGEFIASVRNGIESHAAPSHKNGAFSCYALKDSSSLAQHTAEKTWADAINCGHRGGIFFFCKGIANGCPGGTIWGTGVYTSDSCVCTAALHSGAITPQGGYFSVIHASGQESYPSSTMHGISSLGYSEPWHSSIVIKPLSHNTYAPSFPSSTFMPPPSTSAGC